ncbi:MAG TPA: FAD-dependent oxidoreductase [Kofleriaceae bacterium]|nr:FAD-dependent oxidoreductase [Kofleriaceae bacterium]
MTILRPVQLVSVQKSGDRVVGATVRAGATGRQTQIHALVTIDATEWGDAIPLAGLPYRTGAEARSDTGEPHARGAIDDFNDPYGGILYGGPHPECVQPMTYTFFLQLNAGGDNTIPPPPGYLENRPIYAAKTAGTPIYKEDDTPDGGCAAEFTVTEWRRILSPDLYKPDANVPEWTQINYGIANDYGHNCVGGQPSGCNVIDKPGPLKAEILEAAQNYSLGFAHFLQTDVVRNPGTGYGYPGFAMAEFSAVIGTPATPVSPGGVSLTPYVREGRRIRALTTVLEQDLSLDLLRTTAPTAIRARLFSDSVGIGQYALDVHPCAEGDPFSQYALNSTLPYQIPLGALVPATGNGFIGSGKNIGTTHITNGTYRTQPGEWHIGLASGLLGAMAAGSISHGVELTALAQDPSFVRRLQYKALLDLGSPIYWFTDVESGTGDEILFRATQMTAIEGIMLGVPQPGCQIVPGPQDLTPCLTFSPGTGLTRGIAALVLQRALHLAPVTTCEPPRFTDVPCSTPDQPSPYYGSVQALANAGAFDSLPANQTTFMVDPIVNRLDFTTWLVDGWQLPHHGIDYFADIDPFDTLAVGVTSAAHENHLLESMGIIAGGPFVPAQSMTRADAARFSLDEIRRRYGL